MAKAELITDTKKGRGFAPSVTAKATVPAVIEAAGARAKRRFVEFFTANINNDNTRHAYLRAVKRFCSWLSERNVALEAVEPTLIAFYVAETQKELAPATIKQHLAAIRMLFDFLVLGYVVEVNPAASVRGPKLIIKKSKTTVLAAEEARQLLDSIDT